MVGRGHQCKASHNSQSHNILAAYRTLFNLHTATVLFQTFLLGSRVSYIFLSFFIHSLGVRISFIAGHKNVKCFRCIESRENVIVNGCHIRQLEFLNYGFWEGIQLFDNEDIFDHRIQLFDNDTIFDLRIIEFPPKILNSKIIISWYDTHLTSNLKNYHFPFLVQWFAGFDQFYGREKCQMLTVHWIKGKFDVKSLSYQAIITFDFWILWGDLVILGSMIHWSEH